MAADHPTIGTDYGKFVKFSEELTFLRDGSGGTVTMTPLEDARDEFITVFNTDSTHKFILEAIENWINGYRAALNGVIAALWAGPVALWLTEYVRDQVDGTSLEIQDIVREWGEAMLNDGEDFEELTITIGTITADADNNGDGTLTVIALEPQEGRPNEVVHNEKFRVVCESDSFFGGALPGSEVFGVSASLHQGGIALPVKHAEGFDSNRIVNGGNENFGNDTAGLPDSFQLVTGTAGVDITQEIGAGDFIRGAAAFGIDGDGVVAAVEIKQPETLMAGFASNRRLKPKRFYQISAQIRTDRDAGIAAGDSFRIEFKSTSYVAPAGEAIEILGPDSTAYTEYKATVRMPDDIEDDMALHLTYAGTPAAGATVLVDDLVVAEFVIWEDAGLGFLVTRGPTREWRAGETQDYFSFATTNSEDKRMQRWIIRITDETTADIRAFPGINRMMPSAAAATAAYAEAKAT